MPNQRPGEGGGYEKLILNENWCTGSYGSAFLVTLRNDPTRKYVVKEVTVGHMKPADREKAQQEAELLREVRKTSVLMPYSRRQ